MQQNKQKEKVPEASERSLCLPEASDAQEIYEIVNKIQNKKGVIDGISSNSIKLISIYM